ncbi:MAG: hypothetical protein WBX26_01550 [Candidatus Cybelea sp.]
MIAGDEGGGMHRTDTIDLIVVLEGETTVDYPGEGGWSILSPSRPATFSYNGVFHRWHNRSKPRCSALIISPAAVRKTA